MTQETAIATFSTPTGDKAARIDWIRYFAACLAASIVLYTPKGEAQETAIEELRFLVTRIEYAIIDEQDEGKLESIEANAFTDFFTRTLPKLFGKTFTEDQTKAMAVGIASFVKTDVGALAVSAVEFVQATLPGAGSTEKRDAAKAKLVETAKAAGKDLGSMAGSFLNWSIETALQYVVTKGLTVALGAVAKVA